MSIQTVNPFNNKVVQSFEEMSEVTLDNLVAQSAEAFESWKKTSYEHRTEMLIKVSKLMRERKAELAKTITLEMGKLIAQAEAEIDLSADIFDYYAEHGPTFLADKYLNPKFGKAYYKQSPLGTILGVEPWNFPFYQVARFAAPNLMIGNTVLVKHASMVPQCAIAIEKLFIDAGVPVGVYTNLLISGKRASALVSDTRIKGVSLTGSEEAGSSIAEQAGKYIKKSVLELGGSDAYIVLEDADIDEAVKWGIIGRINNNGECCVAAKRFIVVQEIADEFLEKFTQQMKNLVLGDPMNPKTQLGPLSSEDAAVHIADQVKKAIDAGAKLLLGGTRTNCEGAFMDPTILTDIKPENPVYYQELFGPVVSYYVVKDENEAIKLANDSSYGLGCSIFSNNIDRAKNIANHIDAGMVTINHPTWTTAELPFGGTKNSGYGRELSELGIQEFVNRKLVRISEFSDPM
ncbi:NAD-dependent succinate-semialdehyde dehydrogenase [Flavobacterium restrictum]|uniref:NAD-dependent succinate-semialdehyde dehydrogenase n=1 Tax=Flavobacterium restrictum TaxID=2594428 RepID=A0A553EDQ5_9FLAO|nr:NAD-dependent succinate-semialdehyde dehydrogenase [Flavobacterium restrictum]TRX43135.1 NAD-dependent succinate-semialdehyde dehydrogenase [Flavobacterium restrictum]